MPLRVYDIAKRLGLENQEVLAKAKEMGIAAAKVPSSSLDKITAEWLEEEIIKTNPEVAARLGFRAKRGLLSFGLGHFKAFAEAQQIPIRPLTLIFGANSSGKSSIIHGLLLASEAVKTGKADIFKTVLGGESVDLGGFRQFVHKRRVADRVEWSGEFETRNLSGNAYLVLSKQDNFKVSLVFGMPLDDKGSPEKGKSPRLIYYDIEAGGRIILRLSKRDDGVMQLLRYDEQAVKPIALALLNASTSTVARLASEEDMATITKTIEVVSAEMRFECEGLLPEWIPGQPTGASSLSQWFAIPRSDRQKQLADATRTYFPRAILDFIKGVNSEVRKQLNKLLYLGPLRSFPPRHLAFLEDNDPNWMAGGGYAWDEVRTNGTLRENVNKWLSSAERLKTPYRLEIEKFYAGSEIQTALGQGFNKAAADIVAQVAGARKPDDEETARLLETREELERTRFNLEEQLKSTHVRLMEKAKELNQQQLAVRNVEVVLEKTRIQLEIRHTQEAAHGDKPAPTKDDLEINYNNLKDVLETLRDMVNDLEKKRAQLTAESAKITEDLTLVRQKKEMVFSAITDNIDSEEFVQWLYEEIQARPERTSIDELVLRDCNTDTRVSHRDVGIGVSQVLPVLVHAYADRENIVAIEQPEIHLHPKMQAELGDLFIESALGERKNTFLLETHSEHLILRILRRVRETTEKKSGYPANLPPIKPEDITVIYVDPTTNGSLVKVLTVTPDGDFAEPWPGGFFAERLEDLP